MARTKGRSYENQLCVDIYRETDGQLIPEPIGYSGNHFAPAPDIHIDDGTKIHAIELKRTAQDRITVGYYPDNYQRDDLDQLFTYARDHPRTVVPYVGVRFNNRQLLLCKLWLGAPTDVAIVRSATKFTPTDVRLTQTDNLSIHKPSLENWPSASAGDDVNHVLETIGFR